MKSLKCVAVCVTTFSLRVSVRSDRTLAFDMTTGQAHCGVDFHSTPLFRRGAANLYWKRAAGTARGGPFLFILYAAQFSEIHPMGKQKSPVIIGAGFNATINSNEKT